MQLLPSAGTTPDVPSAYVMAAYFTSLVRRGRDPGSARTVMGPLASVCDLTQHA